MGKKIAAATLVALLAAPTWYFVSEYQKRAKNEAVKQDLDQITLIVEKFRGQLQIAKATPRYALSNRVAEMEQTRQEIIRLEIKDKCFDKERWGFENSMRGFISGYTRFLSGADFNIPEGVEDPFSTYKEKIYMCLKEG